MKKDIGDRKDIDDLLLAFYAKVRADDNLGYIFDDIARVNWEKHLPIIGDFWEGVVFNRNIYKGNPLKVHLDLNEEVRLEKRHFDRWLELFKETLDELYKGPNATLMWQRAMSIATVIQVKLVTSDKGQGTSGK